MSSRAVRRRPRARRSRPAAWSSATGSGSTRRWPPARHGRTSWPRGPAPTRGTSPSGCAARPPAATSSTTPASDSYSLTEEQAFVLTNPDGAVYAPGAFVLALGALQADDRDHRCLPHRRRAWAGTSTTRTCSSAASSSSARATSPTWSRAGCPRWTAWRTSSRAGAQGRRHGLRPRRLHHAAGRGVPAGPVPRLRLPRGLDRAGPQAGRRRRGGRPDRRSRSPRRQNFSGTGYDLVTTFDCLHDMGDPVGAARHIRESLPRTAPG